MEGDKGGRGWHWHKLAAEVWHILHVNQQYCFSAFLKDSEVVFKDDDIQAHNLK